MTTQPKATDPPKLAERAAANALLDERRFEEAHALLHSLVEEDGQEDRVGLLGNACRETGRLDEAELYYARYREFAASAGADLQFDAAIQSALLAKKLGEPSRALTFFLEARNLFARCRRPSVPRGELDGHVGRMIRELTGALAIRV